MGNPMLNLTQRLDFSKLFDFRNTLAGEYLDQME